MKHQLGCYNCWWCRISIAIPVGGTANWLLMVQSAHCITPIELQAGFLKRSYTEGPWCCSDGLRVSIYQNPQASRPTIVPQDMLVLVSRVGFDSWLISNYEQTCAFSLLDLMTCLHFLDHGSSRTAYVVSKLFFLVPYFVVSEKSKAFFTQGLTCIIYRLKSHTSTQNKPSGVKPIFFPGAALYIAYLNLIPQTCPQGGKTRLWGIMCQSIGFMLHRILEWRCEWSCLSSQGCRWFFV